MHEACGGGNVSAVCVVFHLVVFVAVAIVVVGVVIASDYLQKAIPARVVAPVARQMLHAASLAISFSKFQLREAAIDTLPILYYIFKNQPC